MKPNRLAQILSGVILAIFVLLPFHAVFTTWLGSQFGHFDLFKIWKELLLVPLSLGALGLALTDKQIKKWLISSRLVLTVALYASLNLGLGFWAHSRGQVNSSALVYGLLINLRFLLFFLVCLVVASKVSWLTNHWRLYILGPAVIVIGFGLLQQFLLPTNWLSHFGYSSQTVPAYQTVDQRPDFVRLQSTLRGANPLGAYLLLILVAAGLLLAKAKKYSWQLGCLIIAGLFVLFFTYSRSAGLGLVVSLIFVAYWTVKSPRIKRFMALALLVATLLIVGVVLAIRHNNQAENTLFHTSSLSKSPQSSNQQRAKAQIDGVKSVLHEPLGRGPGTAGPASVRNSHSARIAENYFIQIGQEVGLLGLGLFIAINLIIGRQLWYKRSETLPLVLLASLLGLALVNLLSHAWADDSLSYIWWGLAGIALAPAAILNTNTAKQNEKKPKATKN